MSVFRLLKTACAMGALVWLAACGSQDDSIQTPIVRPTSAAPAGIYEGTLARASATEDVTALINGDSSFMLFNADGSLIASGAYTKTEQGRGLTWTARLYTAVIIPGEVDDPDTPVDESTDPMPGQAITTLLANGSYDEESAINMTFIESKADGTPIGSGSLALTYDAAAYESRSDTSLIQGDWGIKDIYGTPTTSVSISEGGQLSGGEEDGCFYSGQFSIIDQHYNLYAINLKTQCVGVEDTLTATGLATLKKATPTSAKTTLQIVTGSSKAAVLLQLNSL